MSQTPKSIPRGAPPRWHRRKAARPAEILDAALHEFGARGFAAARLEDIARRAGCTKGTIFLYFPSKQDLLKALVRGTVVPMLQQAEEAVARHEGTSRALLEKVIRARWEGIYASNLSAIPKLIFSESGNFPELARFFHDEVVARSQGIMQRVLRQGIERGEFRQLDVVSVSRVAFAPMLIASLWKHSFAQCVPSPVDADAYFEASLDLLLRGIAREPSTEGAA